MKQADAVRQLEKEWTALRSVVESVPQEEVSAPGVVDDWSVKDILGHIAFWADRGAITLNASNTGNFDNVKFGEGDNWVDEWNAREAKARKNKPYKEIRGEWLTAHEHARKALEDATDETLNAKYRKGTILAFYVGDTYEHYKEHHDQIKAWLREMETTEK